MQTLLKFIFALVFFQFIFMAAATAVITRCSATQEAPLNGLLVLLPASVLLSLAKSRRILHIAPHKAQATVPQQIKFPDSLNHQSEANL